MCRLIAFPPKFPRKTAEEFLWHMRGNNDDGTGSVYLRGHHFEVNKWPISLDEVLKQNKPLFHHMPHDSWTVAHVRQKTHGDATVANTHPFIKGKYAVVHNGVWHDSSTIRKVLTEFVPLTGQTDSEVAAYLIAKWGPFDFWHDINSAGVYLALHRDGTLWGLNTSSFGDLTVVQSNYGAIVSSELPRDWRHYSLDVKQGWITLDKHGDLTKAYHDFQERFIEKSKSKKDVKVYNVFDSKKVPTNALETQMCPDMKQPNLHSPVNLLDTPWCPICFLYHAPGAHRYPASEKAAEEALEQKKEQKSLEASNETDSTDKTLKPNFTEYVRNNDWSNRSYELEAFCD